MRACKHSALLSQGLINAKWHTPEAVCAWEHWQQLTDPDMRLEHGRCTVQWSQSLEQAARSLITKFNVTVIVASGNSEEDSCYIAPGMPADLQPLPSL